MAISFDTSTQSAASTATPFTWNHTIGVGSNTLLVVGIGCACGSSTQPTVTGVTYNSVAMTKVRGDQIAGGTNDYESSIWFLKAPTVGTHAISVSWTRATFNQIAVGVSASYFGAAQVSTSEAVNGTTGTTTGAKSFNVTTITDNDWVFAAGIMGAFSGTTLAATQTSRGTASGGSPLAVVRGEDTNAVKSPAGAQAMGFTTGGTSPDAYAMSGAAIQPVSGTAFTQALTGGLSFSGSALKATNRNQTATLSFSGGVLKFTARRGLTATLSFTGSFSRFTQRIFTSSLSFAGVFVKTIQRAIPATLGFAGTFGRFINKNLAAGLSFSGSLNRFITRLISGALSFTGAVAAGHLTFKTFTGGLTFNRYKNTILADSPIGYWRLDDTGSTIVDQMNTYPGAFQGSGNTKGAAGLLVGDSNTALTMAGAGGGLWTVGNTPLLTGDWSVECWVNLATLVNGRTIVGISNNSSPFPQNFILGNGGYAGGTQTMFALGYGSNALGFSALFTPANTVVAGQTYHVVGTYTSATKFWTLSVNGGLSNSRTTSSAPVTGQAGEALSVGNNQAGSAGINGTVDEVAIYNYALSSTQIKNHYMIGQDLMNKQTNVLLTGAVSFAGSFIRSVNHNLSATLSFTGTLVRSVSHLLTATLSFTGKILRRITHSLTGTLFFAGSISNLSNKALSATLSFAGAISRTVSRSFSATLSFVGNLKKSLQRVYSAALNVAGNISKKVGQALTGTVSFTGTFGKLFGKTFTGTATFTGSFARNVTKGLNSSLSFTGNINRKVAEVLTGALTSSGSLLSQTKHTFTAAISFSGAVSKQASQILNASLSFTGLFGRGLFKSLIASLGFTGNIGRASNYSFRSNLSFSGKVGKLMAKSLTSGLSFVGTFLIARTLIEAFAKVYFKSKNIVALFAAKLLPSTFVNQRTIKTKFQATQLQTNHKSNKIKVVFPNRPEDLD